MLSVELVSSALIFLGFLSLHLLVPNSCSCWHSVGEEKVTALNNLEPVAILTYSLFMSNE